MNARIKEVRKAAKMTQAAFGDRLGITQNYVALIEGGQREPSDRTLRDICREFNVSETWLRTGAGEMRGARAREEELTELVAGLMADRPESFRSALLTVLLRFRPDGPERAALEAVYNSVRAETEKSPGE